MKRLAYTPRLMRCVALERPCAVCGELTTTNLWDSDLQARVDLQCGLLLGEAETELRRAAIAQPDPRLIHANP